MFFVSFAADVKNSFNLYKCFLVSGWTAVKYFSRILIIVILFIPGCESDNTPSVDSRANHINMYTGAIINYLHEQNLQELESVEQWENDYGPGVKLVTAHYEIFSTLLNRRMLSEIPRFIESAYQAYNTQLPRQVSTSTKFRIYLLEDRTQWEHFTWAFAGEQAEMFCKIKAGAYYHNDACVAYDIGHDRTMSALGHEGWHQFSSRHFKYRLPSWLDEGVAMLFETYRIKDGVIVFDPGANKYRIDSLRDTLLNNSMIPLRELTAINPGQVLATDQTEGVMAFYSQSYALVRFLREANSGRLFGTYQKLLADGLWGNWPLDEISKQIAIDRNLPRTILWNHLVGTQLFQQYINEDFERIEQEYLAFCRLITQY